MSPEAFVQLYGPEADLIARSTGVDRWAILAQWAVETGWGSSDLARYHHNLAGIRWYGRSLQVEHIGGTPGKAGTGFAGYVSLAAFASDYAWVMRLGYYEATRAATGPGPTMLALGNSPWDAGHYLAGGVRGGSLLRAYAAMPKGSVQPPLRPAARTHTVRAGESLWAIAQAVYGSGAAFGRIAAANHIIAPWTIHIGQTLIIP